MPVPEIDVDRLEQLCKQDALVIDVRTPSEYEQAHVPGAQLIPLPDVPDHVAGLSPDVPIYLICQTGARSARAAEFLIAQGLEATNVAGGTKAWIGAGYPVSSGSDT